MTQKNEPAPRPSEPVETVPPPIAVPDADASRRMLADITERKRAEEALRAREAQLSLIYDNAHDVIFVIGVEPHGHFRFISVNRRFAEVTGVPEDQVVGKLVQEVVPESAHVLVLGRYKEAIRSRQPVHWEEVSVYPTGRKVGDVTVAPVFDAKGNCAQLIGTVRDITERKRTKMKLNEQLDELRRWHAVTLDRETRILDIKREVNELLVKAGQPPRYPSTEGGDREEKGSPR